MAQDNDPDAAARWTRDRFEGDVLEYAGVFRLVRPPGWTVTGTTGERYALRPPPGGPAVDVDISLLPRHRVPTGVDAAEYLRLFASTADGRVEDLAVTSDAFGRRATARFHVGVEATSAIAFLTAEHYLLASVSGLHGDDDGLLAGDAVLTAIEPLA